MFGHDPQLNHFYLQHFDDTKSKIKIMRPQQYPNQDIDKITAKYSTQVEQLDIAGCFDCSLILNTFLCASRDDKETPP